MNWYLEHKWEFPDGRTWCLWRRESGWSPRYTTSCVEPGGEVVRPRCRGVESRWEALEPVREAFGVLVREWRIAAGMTQFELGEALGVGWLAISRWERGVTLPDLSREQLEVLRQIGSRYGYV